MKKKTFSLVTLGCFRNRYDSGFAAGRISGQGLSFIAPERISKKNGCDLLIINTCGFIDPAKIESIEAIEDAIRLKKEKKVKQVYVFGCLVQRFAKQLKKHFPGIDKWWGIEKFPQSYRERPAAGGPVEFLKICEGCTNACSYCSIPIIKGPLVSKPEEEIIQEAKAIDKSGVKELNIVGQDITSWGKDLGRGKNLAGLLKKILKQTKRIKWFRLIYTHPRHLSDSLISLISREERICNYIDLPIQHISRRILQAMNRRVSPEEIISLIKKIRKKIPGCVIRTSVIVGFPGESETDFRKLLDFIKKVKFERLGAFIYSREEGTKAAGFRRQVHHMTKKKRFRKIMAAQEKIASRYSSKLIGRVIEVLVLRKEGSFYAGRSRQDAPEVDPEVLIERKQLKIGRIYKLRVTGSLGCDLIAG